MVNESDMITDLEQQLGLPLGFFRDLVKEDDWSFVVKLHALIESTCSLLLRDVFTVSAERFFFKEQRTIDLAKQFSWLELSNVRTGKIAFLKGMQLIEKSHISFIRCLSELRNRLVHDVSNVGFSFNEYINNLDNNQFKEFRSKHPNHPQSLGIGSNYIGIGRSLAAPPSHTTLRTGPYRTVSPSPRL